MQDQVHCNNKATKTKNIMNTKSTSLANYFALSSLASQLSKTLDRNLSIIHGIGITEFTVMHSLQQAPQSTMSRIDLANSIGLSASGVTRLLIPMEKIGLVEKEQNARDARVSLVKLSSAGQRIYTDALTTSSAACDAFYEPLSSKQRTQLNDLVSQLR
ncbi:MAG: DNA-binding MarR family transcriptional regulator [Cryomorphaceae bacterium]